MTNRNRRASEVGREATRRLAGRAARPMLLAAACVLLTGCPPDPPAGQPGAPGDSPGQPASPGGLGGAFALYDQPFRGRAVQEYIHGRQCEVNRLAEISCPHLGLELGLDHNDVVRMVRTYVNAIGYFTSYPGPFPYGITAADSREEVVRKVGEPSDRFSDSDLFKATSPWLNVKYHPPASQNAGRIREVVLSRPR
jgi:hypothetical protein